MKKWIMIISAIIVGILCIVGIIVLVNYFKESDDAEEVAQSVKEKILLDDPTPTPTEIPQETIVEITSPTPTESVKQLNIPTGPIEIAYDDLDEGEDDGTETPTKTPTVKPKYTVVCEENPDYVGWVNVPDTRIDYPVVLNKEDPDYYLKRNFYGNTSSSGTIFCYFHTDIERPSDNIMMYGHNMKSGTMFHDLHKFKEKSFYENHKEFTFNSIYEDGTYEIIGVILTDANPGNYEKYTQLEFSETTYKKYIEYVKENSLYETEGINNAQYGDKLVTLCTCSYQTDNGRLVVIGRKIK